MGNATKGALAAINPLAAGSALAGWGIFDAFRNKPKLPTLLTAPPVAPDATTEAVRQAKLMERRRQIGLSSRTATWLTGARGDTVDPVIGTKTLLGG